MRTPPTPARTTAPPRSAGANHYGLPGYAIPRGYTRLYGPWLMHVSVGATQDAMLAQATSVAQSAILASYNGLPQVVHPLYPVARANVTGRVVISDGRPAGGLWAVLSTQLATDVCAWRAGVARADGGPGAGSAGRAAQGRKTRRRTHPPPLSLAPLTPADEIHENTYFVLTAADGSFAIPGVPPGNYTLYVQGGGAGTVYDVLRRPGVLLTAGVNALGTIAWTPSDATHTHLWAVGGVDRSGGEFALARAPRDWYLPGAVPGSLTFTVGSSHEPSDWYYAQTQGGTWTIAFTLPTTYAGTASLVVSASLTQGDSPTVTVNGVAPSGRVPSGSDSTLSRQAVRSGYPKLAVLTFPASTLVAGPNTVRFTRGAAGGSNNTGMGYDAVLLNVDTGAAGGGEPRGAPALAAAAYRVAARADGSSVWRVAVTNGGAAPAMLPRVEALEFLLPGGGSARPTFVDGRDPHAFPLPVAPFVAAGGGAVAVDVLLGPLPAGALGAGGAVRLRLRVTADGGRAAFDGEVAATAAQ